MAITETDMFYLKYQRIISFVTIILYLATSLLVLFSALLMYPPSYIVFATGIKNKTAFAVRTAIPFLACGTALILINLITKQINTVISVVLFAFSGLPFAMILPYRSSVPGNAYRYLYSVIIFFAGCCLIPLITCRHKAKSERINKIFLIAGYIFAVISLFAAASTLYLTLSGGAVAKVMCFLYAFFPLTFTAALCIITAKNSRTPDISFAAASILCAAAAALFIVFRAYGVANYQILALIMLGTGVLLEIVSLCANIYRTVRKRKQPVTIRNI